MKKNLPLLEEIEIQSVAAEGKSVARVDDKVVFVPYVVPGDIVDLQVKRKKHSYMEAVAVKFHRLSPLRAQPFCAHYGVCGGCKWQCLKYEEQLKAKQQQVVDCLTRIGHLTLPEVSPILGSEKTTAYRNKLEFGFSDRRWRVNRPEDSSDSSEGEGSGDALGFHIAGAFDKILDITECHLMDTVQNSIRNEIRDYAIRNHLVFYDLRNNTGLLRSMMVRLAVNGLMVLIQFRIENQEEHKQAMDLMQFVADRFPQITSLLYVDNHKGNDTFADQQIIVYKGEDHIIEEMEDLQFKVGPKSFYQTNTDQAYVLYSVVRSFAQLTGNELVYDLYTGTGTIAHFLSRQARQVVGIEYVPEAIEDAKVNSSLNHISNTLFYAGDMKDILTDDFISQHGRPDVIVTDPPRAGMHKDVIKVILKAAPEKIVYVSCNPATQARDLEMLTGGVEVFSDKDSDHTTSLPQYIIERVQPVDMFPHTQHVENVVLLTKKH